RALDSHFIHQSADRRDEGAQRDHDEVDVCDGQGDVPADHDAARQHAIEQVDKRDLAIVVRRQHFGHGLTTSPANEYGGHGPVISSVIPGISRSTAATAALNSSTSDVLTR